MRIESYAQELEDVVLYSVLRDVGEVIYIDVGANDPTILSVTKMFYLMGGHGVNIEPLRNKCLLLHEQRPRDINLCVGIGKHEGKANFGAAGCSSSFNEDVIKSIGNVPLYEKKITTLSAIYRKYCSRYLDIHFCKIDVEGYEGEVLRGIDNWNEFRPWIYVIESTVPGTYTPSYEGWESILLDNDYFFVYSSGINRFYLAKEHEYLTDRFMNVDTFIKQNNVIKLVQDSSVYC